jgi:predicted nucleic acid-binding protein
MIIISDTSPLICLLHLKKINLLKNLFINVISPTAVFDQLVQAKTIDETFFTSYPFIQIKTALDQKEVLLLRNVLDAGEYEAIVLSKELKADLLLIDEDRGRKSALNYGLTIKGFGSVDTGKRKAID